MKVGDGAPFTPLRRSQTIKKTTGGGAFAKSLKETSASQETSLASSCGDVASLNSLMALQEVSDALSGKSRAFSRAQDMLEILEKMRTSLLIGHFSKRDLEDIAKKVSTRVHENVEPDLQELLEQIEQRVHIELAKLEMTYGSDNLW
ncbi:MAG: flagellar assembly protein FliX [Alphaproteobacteria bacterium]|jgi:small-conductance mechanosensitive channel|nr:flagellar assembly protein FliX [Alphaproteobacteria bacterium]